LAASDRISDEASRRSSRGSGVADHRFRPRLECRHRDGAGRRPPWHRLLRRKPQSANRRCSRAGQVAICASNRKDPAWVAESSQAALFLW